MLDKKTYRETFSALHASGDTLKEVYDMIEKRRRGSLGRSFLAVAAVVALMLALCAVAYAADWFGFRALLRPGTTEFEGQTYNNISLTQPQAVPPGLDSSIAEKVENSKAAWAEFSAWRVEHDPMKDLPEVFQGVLGMGITDLEDGGAELQCNTEDGLETRYATPEEYAQFRALMDELGEAAGLSPAVLAPVLKTVGIAILTHISAEVCRDAKESGIAAFVETAGAAVALCVALPLLRAVLDTVTGLL